MDLKFGRNVLPCGSQPDQSQFLKFKKLETRTQFAELNSRGKKSSKFTKYQKIVLLSLTILQIASYASKGVVAPFFPEEARIKGVSLTMSGFIFSSYSLFMFISAPFMSFLNGKFGTKTLLLGGVLLQAVGNLQLGFWDLIDSTDAFVVLCLISRMMEGVGATAFYTSRHTFAAQVFPDDVNFVVGILGIALGVGYCAGPASGGLLYNLGGYQFPFYVLGGILLFMLPLTYYLIPGGTEATKIEALKKKRMSKILKLKPIIIIGLVVIVISIVWEFIMATISVELIQKFSISPSQVSVFFFVITGSLGISSLCWGYVADRTQRVWIIIAAGLFIAGVSTLFLGPSPVFNFQSSLVIYYVVIVIFSNAVAMSFPLSYGATIKFAVDADYVSDENMYAFLASYNWSLSSFGGIVGPILGSFLIEKFEFPLACSTMGIACLIMGFIMTIYFSLIYKTSGNFPNVSMVQEASEAAPLL